MEMENADRGQYVEWLEKMVAPLTSHYSPGRAELRLGGFQAGFGNKIAGMEGFVRPLWGLAPLWRHSDKFKELIPVYQVGLLNGTNPRHPEYWGNLHDRDQRMVEMAAISYALLIVPELLWEPFSQEERKNIASWLYQINLYSQPQNNWQFYKVITNIALKKCGMPYSQEQIDSAIAEYESYYLGKGWYGDGKRAQKDYYISFGIHFYCLLYSIFMMEEDTERCLLYRKRADEFAKSFLYWFDETGRSIPYGRSMTYRFAQVAFFSTYIQAGLSAIPLGTVKAIITGNLKNWMEQPIFDNGGILTVGYYYPNLLMSEGYNSPGSPYWAFKTFTILNLPPEHPFWEAPCSSLKFKEILAIPECDMLIQHKKAECIAYTAGQYPLVYHAHCAEKYAKFVYSSVFGFSVPRSYLTLSDCAPDSMLVFQAHDMLYVRRSCEEFEIRDDAVESRWSPVEGIEVITTIKPCDGGHLRRHVIKANIPCLAYDCGFSYPRKEQGCECITEAGLSEARDKNGYSRVVSGQGEGIIIQAAPNTNLIFPYTVIPAIKIEVKEGTSIIETEVEAVLNASSFVVTKGDCYEV